MERLLEWTEEVPLILRIDFGYEIPFAYDYSVDALFVSLSDLVFLNDLIKERKALLVKNSHYLFPAKTKKNDFFNLKNGVFKKRVIFETRFKKYYEMMRLLFDREKIVYKSIDLQSDGSLPPLYNLIKDESLFFKTLCYEWESGILTARGKSSLIKMGKILSQNPSGMKLVEIASNMGLTLGATKSYLKWMLDASLIREEDKKYSLRHEGLYLLFSKGKYEKEKKEYYKKRDFEIELD